MYFAGSFISLCLLSYFSLRTLREEGVGEEERENTVVLLYIYFLSFPSPSLYGENIMAGLEL